MSFFIDGIEWEIPCNITRISEVSASEISGMLLDKSYFNDVIGTYLSYEITMAVPNGMEHQYNLVYEHITAPVDGHSFVLPYANETIEITGRVANIRDVYRRISSNLTHWVGIQFTVIANHPSKEQTLDGAITRGLSPLPDESGIEIGAIYQNTPSGWQELDLVDADGVYY